MVRNSMKDAREMERRRKAKAKKTGETPFVIHKAKPKKTVKLVVTDKRKKK